MQLFAKVYMHKKFNKSCMSGLTDSQIKILTDAVGTLEGRF